MAVFYVLSSKCHCHFCSIPLMHRSALLSVRGDCTRQWILKCFLLILCSFVYCGVNLSTKNVKNINPLPYAVTCAEVTRGHCGGWLPLCVTKFSPRSLFTLFAYAILFLPLDNIVFYYFPFILPLILSENIIHKA